MLKQVNQFSLILTTIASTMSIYFTLCIIYKCNGKTLIFLGKKPPNEILDLIKIKILNTCVQ